MCVGNDSLTKLLCSAPELAVLLISDAPARVDLLCVDDIFRQPEALMSKTGHRQRTRLGSQRFTHRAAMVGTQLSSLRLQRRSAKHDVKMRQKGAIARAGPFLRSDVHFQRTGVLPGLSRSRSSDRPRQLPHVNLTRVDLDPKLL